MKRKGSIEAIKEIEQAVRRHCKFLVIKDSSNGVRQVFTRVYVINSKYDLILLRLEFEPRGEIGRLFIRNDQVNILCNQVPPLRKCLERLKEQYLKEERENGVRNRRLPNNMVIHRANN